MQSIYKNVLDRLLPKVFEAAEEVMKIYNSDFHVNWKKEGDPLTEADLKANSILSNFIHQNYPDDAILSEESADIEDRLHAKRVWIIDPIDGTREFVTKNPEFAISIALVEDRRSVLGVIFNPATGELICGIQNEGVFYRVLKQPFPNGSIPLHFSKNSDEPKKKPVCMVSFSESKEGIFQKLPLVNELFYIQPVGSVAYKLGLLAAGKCDLVFSVYPKNEWDICAGVGLLEAAGMKALELTSFDSILFNSYPPVVLNGLLAGKKELIENIQRSYKKEFQSFFRERS
ncbi:MAG: 3'(2'),5'-bisphosphate nucleotidase CysQ [Leptospiraceae bacterium]|nr:3'(2'),5'-bisphosphate nucleotidase CysQ [Leptospiraceae bacterium]MCP5502158.1 3'(2'),5'-bisphosphate nucleotidase CysQ [Leptospiraceae bacterium]